MYVFKDFNSRYAAEIRRILAMNFGTVALIAIAMVVFDLPAPLAAGTLAVAALGLPLLQAWMIRDSYDGGLTGKHHAVLAVSFVFCLVLAAYSCHAARGPFTGKLDMVRSVVLPWTLAAFLAMHWPFALAHLFGGAFRPGRSVR
jgi:hypothetical protein